MAIVDNKIKSHKQSFGLVLFLDFVKAEDERGWLPSDRQVRSIYDTCRGDIQRMESTKKQKAEDIRKLGGTVEDTTTPSVVENSAGAGFGSNANPNDLSMQSSYTAPTAGGYSDTTASSGDNGAEDLLL